MRTERACIKNIHCLYACQYNPANLKTFLSRYGRSGYNISTLENTSQILCYNKSSRNQKKKKNTGELVGIFRPGYISLKKHFCLPEIIYTDTITYKYIYIHINIYIFKHLFFDVLIAFSEFVKILSNKCENTFILSFGNT